MEKNLLLLLIIFAMNSFGVHGNGCYGQERAKMVEQPDVWKLTDTNLLYHSWYSREANSISFNLDGVAMWNPLTDLHATYPCRLLAEDSIYIDFDEDTFKGRYKLFQDSLFMWGVLNNGSYSWRAEYDKEESENLRKNAWKYIPKDGTLSQQMKGIWIRVEAGDDYTSADIAISDSLILLVDMIDENNKMIELHYHMKGDTMYWKIGNAYYKGVVGVDDRVLTIRGSFGDKKPGFDLSGVYEEFATFEKRIRMKNKQAKQ